MELKSPSAKLIALPTFLLPLLLLPPLTTAKRNSTSAVEQPRMNIASLGLFIFTVEQLVSDVFFSVASPLVHLTGYTVRPRGKYPMAVTKYLLN